MAFRKWSENTRGVQCAASFPLSTGSEKRTEEKDKT